MKPGRELDALVAEKVMGLQVFKSNFDNLYFADSYTVKPYSTDIVAAWEVVSKFEREASICSNPGGGWKASFIWHDSNPYSNECVEWSYGDTAPLAICLAALKAVGVNR